MSKKIEKALNEKLNVKLPENLSKDNIFEQLEFVQQNEKIIEMPKKKNNAKRIIPVAASFAIIIGLLSAYFGFGLGEKTSKPSTSDKIEVMRYQSYDKIYDKFENLRKEYIKNGFDDILVNVLNGSFTYAADDFVINESAENVAGNVLTGQANSSDSSMPESAPEADASTSTTNKDFGTTNRQEEDVDEGDIIKTDGNYLYVVTADRNLVSIVDVQSDDMKELSQIKIDKTECVEEIYINESMLIIIGSVYEENWLNGKISSDDAVAYGTTYPYGYGNLQNASFVKIYDITDRTSPKLVTEYSQQGSYDSSRMIGTKLYNVSTYYVNIRDDNYRDQCIPETEINGVCEKIPADCISVIEESVSSTYAVITTIDVKNDTEPKCEAILGNCDELYASSKGLFLSETAYDKKTYEENTKIYRFEYTDTGVNFKCMGKVAGYINDQFSMSYDGEYFRIATTLNKTETSGDWVGGMAISTSNRINNLYILNNNMQIVGKVEDLAKGETIQSVRFVGNMAYVVTFRQTDPLFVIDLSDPTKPTVKGELKIPGFSEYLHPIADGLLVGVGYDGTESGTNGDCKVSLFDVSNPYEPKETSVVRVTNGDGSVYNSIGMNHKLYIKLSENEFAVPFNVRWFVHNGEKGRERGEYYIRYRLEDGKLNEVSRYYMCDEETAVMGATYVEDTFYAVVDCYNQGTCVVSFDLTTNQEVDRVLLNEWE